jgi:HK97 family phage prohead protease
MRLRQLRAFRLDDVQVADVGHVTYHASMFGVRDSYDTIFDRGCFSKTINDHSKPPAGVTLSPFLADAPGGFFAAVWFHTPWEPLALTRVAEDETGLLVRAELDLDIERGREVYSGMRRGYINCASHSFSVVTEAKENGEMHFKEVELFETSPLTMNFASNPAALVDEVRARTGLDYPKPPVIAVTESDLRGMMDALRGLQHRELTDAEATLVAQCSVALQTMITAEEGRPYPNEHACRLQAPSKFSDFRRGTRKHEGKVYSIIFGKLKDEDTWEEQAYRYAKDVWEAADARAHCKSHDGSFEAASGQDAISCALSDTSTEAPIFALPSLALMEVQRELAAARASRGPVRPPSETRRTPIIAPDIHAVITDLRALGGRL